MNTDHPDSRRTASEINETNRKQAVVNALDSANQRIDDIQRHLDAVKPSPNLPAAWLHIESANNGWSIFVKDKPRFGANIQPDFVFNNVFDCARKIVNLLDPQKVDTTLESVTIKRLSEALLCRHGDNLAQASKIKELEEALLLMTAGRDQDRAEAKERCDEYQKRIENQKANLVNARMERYISVAPDDRDAMIKALHLECDSLRAQVHELKVQRDTYRQNLANLTTVYNALVQESGHRLNRINDLEAELTASTARNNELINQREHALKRWREDNVLANNRLARIRELESEISALGKLLQSTGRTMASVGGQLYTIDDLCKEHSALKEDYDKIQVELANLRTDNRIKGEEISRLQGVVGRLQVIVRNVTTKNTDLETVNEQIRRDYETLTQASGDKIRSLNENLSAVIKRSDGFEQLSVKRREHIEALIEKNAGLSEKNAGLCADLANLRTENRQYGEQLTAANRVLQAQWKLGFDAGTERVMKYVSAFSKEQAERLARNQNPS